MTKFIRLHTDAAGEAHQLTGAWEAVTPADALALMLSQAGETDDGAWEAREVASDRDIIQ